MWGRPTQTTVKSSDNTSTVGRDAHRCQADAKSCSVRSAAACSVTIAVDAAHLLAWNSYRYMNFTGKLMYGP